MMDMNKELDNQVSLTVHFRNIPAQEVNVPFVQYVHHFPEAFITRVYSTHIFKCNVISMCI